MREIVVGGFLGRNGFCGFDGIVLFQRRRMVEKRVVGDLEEPGLELAAVGIAVNCEVGLALTRDSCAMSSASARLPPHKASRKLLRAFCWVFTCAMN